MSEHPPDPAPISTVAEPPRIVELVNEHARPKPAATSTVHELSRTTDRTGSPAPASELSLVRIERRMEPRAPESALVLEAEHGKSKLRALACSPLAVVAVVLIVSIIVAGKVLIAWHDGAQREDPVARTSAGVPSASSAPRSSSGRARATARDLVRTIQNGAFRGARELGYPRDDGDRQIACIAAGCDCGWRSPRWVPHRLATWAPFSVAPCEADEDVIAAHPLRIDAAATHAELVRRGERTLADLVASDVIDLAGYRRVDR